MENIRIILLLVGLVLIFLVYVVSRYQARRTAAPRRGGLDMQEAQLVPGEPEPDADIDAELEQLGKMIAEDDDCAGFTDCSQAEPMPVIGNSTGKSTPVSRDIIFSLFVRAPRGVPFRGSVLLGGLAAAGLEFGDMEIFHQIENTAGQERLLFSAANLREPGTFDLAEIENFTTEGVVLFMQVHGNNDAVYAFDAMVKSARILADSLDSPVSDASQSVLTSQILSHMREEVISCQLQQQLAKTAS